MYVHSSRLDEHGWHDFSDASLDSAYGWIAGNATSDPYLEVHFPSKTWVAGLWTMGTTFDRGGLGVTMYRVEFNDGTSNRMQVAYNNETLSEEFEGGTDTCSAVGVWFAYVAGVKFLRIIPTKWITEHTFANIQAPAMRVGVQICEP